MTRLRGELTEPEEMLLGIERPSLEAEEEFAKQDAEKRERQRRFLIGLMMDMQFRAWLMAQLVGFRTFEKPFGVSPGGFPDRAASEYQDGLRAAGWHLWTLFDDVAPDFTSLMRREYSER